MEDFEQRLKNRVSAFSLGKAEDHLREMERLEREARKDRGEKQERFWWEFDRVFQPGDRIQWYNGWEMQTGTFRYHTDWHVYVRTDDGVEIGLPVVVDTDYEKIEGKCAGPSSHVDDGITRDCDGSCLA